MKIRLIIYSIIGVSLLLWYPGGVKEYFFPPEPVFVDFGTTFNVLTNGASGAGVYTFDSEPFIGRDDIP